MEHITSINAAYASNNKSGNATLSPAPLAIQTMQVVSLTGRTCNLVYMYAYIRFL